MAKTIGFLLAFVLAFIISVALTGFVLFLGLNGLFGLSLGTSFGDYLNWGYVYIVLRYINVAPIAATYQR